MQISGTAYAHIGRLNKPAPSDISTQVSLHWSPLKGPVHLEHSIYKTQSTEFSTKHSNKTDVRKGTHQFCDSLVVMLQSPSK